MTNYTDPPRMPENERMQPIEFKVVREWLGVSGAWLAGHLKVNPRTVREWEEGRSKIPDGIRAELEHLEAITGRIVTMNIEALNDANEPAVATYRTDEAYWAAEPSDGPRWPATWHRRVVMRIAQEVPGLVIVEAGPGRPPVPEALTVSGVRPVPDVE